MKVGAIITLALIAFYIYMSWIRWESVEASIISFCSFVVLAITEPAFITGLWRLALFEYWLAILTWLAFGGLLLYRLKNHKSSGDLERMSGQTIARRLLVVLVVSSILAPLLVNVRPEAQGNLMTTRLLPPASAGVMYLPDDVERMPLGDGSLVQAFEGASNFLLHRAIVFSGDGNQLEDSPMSRKERILFVFGTDDNGRDVLSRLLFGARVSLAIGFAAALASLAIGCLVGFLAGYSHGIIDAILMRATDLMLSVPALFVVIAGVAFLGTSAGILIIILSLTGWMSIARIVRGEIQRLREAEFILAARMLGRSTFGIFTSHFLPNLKPILITSFVLQFGNVVLAESSLSFLGLGVQPPTPSWGNMLGQSLSYIHSAWWLGFFPGVFLSAVLMLTHFAVEGREQSQS